eukprot:TRINITY_DN2920_c0_g1_i25.p1 TRINITY_DN2920_c0_g1~~TRINITY_DN2920_c0_g1_i25.p1  ORF type:complete len:112 (+),score=18.34 TRINITY_DN2920_c0_g1_i25:211-546(+)
MSRGVLILLDEIEPSVHFSCVVENVYKRINTTTTDQQPVRRPTRCDCGFRVGSFRRISHGQNLDSSEKGIKITWWMWVRLPVSFLEHQTIATEKSCPTTRPTTNPKPLDSL